MVIEDGVIKSNSSLEKMQKTTMKNNLYRKFRVGHTRILPKNKKIKVKGENINKREVRLKEFD